MAVWADLVVNKVDCCACKGETNGERNRCVVEHCGSNVVVQLK